MVHFIPLQAVHFKLIRTVQIILICPVHLKVIWAVHLIRCNHIGYKFIHKPCHLSKIIYLCNQGNKTCAGWAFGRAQIPASDALTQEVIPARFLGVKIEQSHHLWLLFSSPLTLNTGVSAVMQYCILVLSVRFSRQNPHFRSNPYFLKIVGENLLFTSQYWHNTEEDYDRIRRKQAEFLVKSHVPAKQNSSKTNISR